MKQSVLALFIVAAAGSMASASISYTGPVSENFDTLSNANVTAAFSATVGSHSPIPGLASWDGTRVGGSGTTMNFVADAGGGNSGAAYSYGVASTTERALGALASGTHIGAFGVELINNTADSFFDVFVTLDREQWRSSTSATGTPNTLTFAYGFSGGAITSANYLTEASMLGLPAGNLVGDAPVTTNGPLAPSVVALAFTITGINWAPGQSLFIRWQDFNDQGNDAGLAIDNFTLTGLVPTPGAAALLGLAGLAGLRRRR